jgi:valyl-tRNA synthetase
MWQARIDDENSGDNAAFAINWFESRLNDAKAEVEVLMKQFRLSEALKTIYSLIWDDFCNWYLEWVKPGFEQPINANVYQKTIAFFTDLLQLLHPYMPFVTEEIYHLLEERNEDLCVKQFAPIGNIDKAILAKGNLLKDAITAVRDARNKAQLKPKETIELSIQSNEQAAYNDITELLSKQVNAKSFAFANEAVAQSINVVVGKDKFYLVTETPLNTGHQKEELEKELEYQKGFLASVEKKLSNERFVQNAKPEVVEFERKKKADAEDKIKVLEESLKAI